MAFPELPDDRRARPRRYRGGAVDGGPDIPDDRRYSARRAAQAHEAAAEAGEQEWPLGAGARAHGARSDEDRPGDPRRSTANGRATTDGGGHRRRAPDDDGARHSANGNGYVSEPGRGGPPPANGDGRPPVIGRTSSNGHPADHPSNGHPADHRSNGRGGHPGNGHPQNGAGSAGTNGSGDGRPSADRVRDAYPFGGSGPDDAPRDEGRRRRRYLDERGPDEFAPRSATTADREPRPPAPAGPDDGPRFADGRRPPHVGDAAYEPGPPRTTNGNGRRPPAPDETGWNGGPPTGGEPTGRRRRLDDADGPGAPPTGRRRLAPDPAGDRPAYGPGQRNGSAPESAGHSRAPVEPGPPRPGDDPRAGRGRTAPRQVPDPRSPDPRGPDPRGSDPRSPDPRGLDPRGPDPRGPDPRGPDPRGPDPRAQDPRFRGPEPDLNGRPRRDDGNRPPSRPDADAPGAATHRTRRDDGPARRGPSTGAQAYVAGDDLDDVDEDAQETRAVPVRRGRRPGPRPDEPPDDTSADPTARPRAPGRRTGRPAAPPDPDEVDEYDDPDADDEPFDDETDDPREGKRSGPVGIGGKLSALTSRRSGTEDGGKKKPFWRELPLLLGVALVLTFLIQTFVAKVFVIPSGSMETTLHGCTGCTNDRVLVDKVTYNFTDIAPGDVVVFRGPPNWADSEYQLEQSTNPIVRGLQTAGSLIGFAPPDEQDFVKRVIAVGGQTVSCCDALNQVMVNGQPLDEPYIYYLPEAGPARQIPFGPITVPQGELWVMGDSRNNSADARAHGPVPEENVIGKVRLIVLPFDRFGWVDAVDPQTSATAAGPPGGLPQGTALALGMMGTFPLALSRRRSLAQAAERERFVPVARRRTRWRRR